MRPQGPQKEKVKLNLARLKKEGTAFEVVIDPDKAIDFKKGNTENISEVLMSDYVFFDAKKGQRASEKRLAELFDTENEIEIAKKIIIEGEIQLTEEYRDSLREQKKKRIVDLIKTNAIDPKTGHPIPATRIENALEEGKIKIDEKRLAEEQIPVIISKLRPILPIKFATKKIEVRIPQSHSHKTMYSLRRFGNFLNEEWQKDGSVKFEIELPAGLTTEFFNILNKETQGNSETNIQEE